MGLVFLCKIFCFVEKKNSENRVLTEYCKTRIIVKIGGCIYLTVFMVSKATPTFKLLEVTA